MAAPTRGKPLPNSKPVSTPDDDRELDEAEAEEANAAKSRTALLGPPEEEFWNKYNKRLEFPLSTVSAILLHVFVGALLVFILVKMGHETDKSNVPVKLVEINGMDDGGEGSAGSGGQEDPFFKADGDPDKSDVDSLADPTKLPDIKKEITQKYLADVGNMPISDSNAAAYKNLNENLRKKLLGAREGSGPGQGSGYDGTQGKGPGGTGADSTLGRNMRWVLRFKVTSGDDYLNQLKAMEAEVLVPIPGGDKCYIVKDLKSKSSGMATDDDLKRLANKIKFSDSRPQAVRDVVGALGLNVENPKQFWAFFPKNLEDEMAKKETGYRNRRAEDIEETIFRVAIRGGSFELLVDEQKIKR